MSSTTAQNRRFLDTVVDAGSAALPYGFAVSGLALGVGALVTQIPLVGTCGAVAGVTAGLLAQRRTKDYRQQAVALRERLRQQRVQTDTTTTELRSRVSALEIAVWEVRTLALRPEPVVVEEPVAVEEPVVEETAPAVEETAPVVEETVAEKPEVEVTDAPEVTVAEEAEIEATDAPEVTEAPVVQARPGLRLAQAAARISVPRNVLDAAVATTGSLSLAEIAKAAEKRAAEKEQAVPAA